MKWNWFEDGKWKVCPFTRCDAVREQMPLLPERFHVRDVTLKEGSDVPGAHFSMEGTVELVAKMAEIGIEEIDVGRPTFIDKDREQIRAIKDAGIKIVCSPNIGETLIPYDTREHIDRCMEAGADNIKLVIVHTYSEDILVHLKRAVDAVHYVHDRYGKTISISWDDTTKQDLETLKMMYRVVYEAGIDRLWVSDEGNATPLAFKYLTSELRKVTGDIPLVLHCHNDFGLAVANTLAAVEAGASWADVAINGYGDRGGNAAMEEVVAGLEMLYGVDTGIDMGKLCELSELAQRISGVELQPHKAIVGRNASMDTASFVLMDVPINEHISINPEVFGRKHTLAWGLDGTLQLDTVQTGLKKCGLRNEKEDAEKVLNELERILDEEIVIRRRRGFVTMEEFADIARRILGEK